MRGCTWPLNVLQLLFCCWLVSSLNIGASLGADFSPPHFLCLLCVTLCKDWLCTWMTVSPSPQKNPFYGKKKWQKSKTLKIIVIFFFSFLAALRQMEFLGQGSDPSHSFDLHCSCGNTRTFNPLFWEGSGTCVLALCFRDTSSPIVPQQELL